MVVVVVRGGGCFEWVGVVPPVLFSKSSQLSEWRGRVGYLHYGHGDTSVKGGGGGGTQLNFYLDKTLRELYDKILVFKITLPGGGGGGLDQCLGMVVSLRI